MDNVNPGLARVTSDTLHEYVVDVLVQHLDEADGGILVLAIDGKAAAGKSTWASALANRLKSAGRNAAILEADWFLKDRGWRNAQMEKLETRKAPKRGVVVPADFHLQFWNWNKLDDAMEEVEDSAKYGEKKVPLEGVYNRKTGNCDDVEEITIGPGAVLIVPGSYLLAQRFRTVIDCSILLYVNKEEGRRRKLNREIQKGEFPSAERIGTVISTWELIEEPTFLRHMIAHGSSANIIIDNSDPIMPSVIKFEIEPSAVVRRSLGTRGGVQIPAGQDSIGRFVQKEATHISGNLASLVDPAAVELTFAENDAQVTIALPPLSPK